MQGMVVAGEGETERQELALESHLKQLGIPPEGKGEALKEAEY